MSRFDECPANEDKKRRGQEPCSDWEHHHCDGCNMYEAYLMGKRDAVPKGKWVKSIEKFTNEDGLEIQYYRVVCSHCNQANSWGDVDYCPWCGARMEVLGDDE